MNLLPLKSEGSYLSAVVARGGDGEFFIFPSEMLFPFEDMGQTWPPVMGGAGCALLGAPAERGSEEARKRGSEGCQLAHCPVVRLCLGVWLRPSTRYLLFHSQMQRGLGPVLR